ncbi:MAG: hypothetical protein ACYTE8_13390 [Planctomycetota bacterium]
MSRGFLERMKKEADIPAIRDWLESYTPTKEEENFIIMERNWPDVIKELSPNFVYIMETSDGIKYTRLDFGGILASFGLVVGPSTMEIPESDFNQWSEHRTKLTEGAYVWYIIE